MMKTRIWAAGLLGLAVAACGGSDNSKDAAEQRAEDYAAAHGIDADVTVDDGGDVSEVVINAPNGGRVGNNLDLPSGFPDDVVLPAGWAVQSTSPVPPDGFMVTAQSTDSVEDIIAAIEASMADKGWTQTAKAQPSPQMSQLGYEKDGRMANFNLIIPDGPVSIQLMTMTKPG